MNQKPLISIIIPVYNGGDYVKEAIDSALSQTYENFEVLVINDGSKDEGITEKIALSYGDKIRYFYKENGGVSSALNLGIANMKGEYFSWLSHDDKYEPRKIENQINLLLAQNDKKLLALCGNRQIDKNSKFLNEKPKIYFKQGEIVGWEKALGYMLDKGVYGGCDFLIPNTAFDECGGFDESLRYTQDMFMWLKMFLAGYGIVYDDTPDSLTRIHNAQLTQTGRVLYYENCEKMAKFLIPAFIETTTKENKLLYYYGKYNAKYAVKIVWKKVLRVGKEEKILPIFQRLKIRIVAIYGNVRPWIRKVYYRVFKKVKTQ